MNPDTTSNLSPDQVKALQELKHRVIKEHGETEGEDEYRLRRFLKARDFDVNKAEAMLRNSIIWRSKNQIDRITQDYNEPEVLTKYLPISKFGLDSEGRRIVFMHFGNLDFRGILSSANKSEFIKSIFLSVEKDVAILEENNKKTGKVQEQWTYIFDFENFSLAQATYKEGVEVVMHFVDVYEKNYPERLYAAFIINASVYFTILFSFVKPVLSGETLRKLSVYGKDGWKEALLEFLPADNLPAFLGGNQTDPDGNPKCLTKVNHGGLVPKSYYVPKMERCLAKESNVKQYSINRMSRLFIEIHINESGSKIEWEFETENYDIGFGITCAVTDPPPTEQTTQIMVPVQKVDTRFLREVGVYTCTMAGIYSLVFDNSFSWFRQKELFCRAHVITPSGERICVTQT